MEAKYSATSPYGQTGFDAEDHLGYFKIRPIPSQSDDFLYTVEPQYNHRPDLLAYDLYSDPKLWWVFAQRNMDVLIDPVYDLIPGTQIYIPQGPQLRSLLGI